ncbi:MAG: hypothetical protein IJF17_13740 [Thermoguttaceae bacterium]|nr:hypothetical protein [Thermoguttaceae bacterium]
MRILLDSFILRNPFFRRSFLGAARSLFCLCVLPMSIFNSGCSGTNNLTLQGQVSDLQNQRVAIQNERDAWKTRYEELSNSNRVQTHELASSQQQIMTLKQEQLVLQQQLKDTLEQVATAQKQNEYLSKQLARYEDIRHQQENGIQFASTPSPEKTAITQAERTLPSIPGTLVSTVNGEIHIELPGETLFEQSGAISPKGLSLIKETGRTIASQYPGAYVEIQGHLSSFQKVSSNFKDPHQQSTSQAMIVKDILIQENILPEKLLKVSGCGTSNPIISSATSKGVYRNYRIELVITPETP